MQTARPPAERPAASLRSAAENELQRTLEALLEGVIVLDESGRVQRINAEACRMLETSPESAAGGRLDDLIGESHPIAELARRVLESRSPAVQGGVEIARRYGADIEAELAVSPISEPADRSAPTQPGRGPSTRMGVVVAIRDHTLGNSLREEVSRRAELTSYGHIAAGIAHEVKNPLSGIRGAAELLGRWAEQERARRTAELIVREVDRISELVEQLMVFAKGEHLRLAPVNLHRLIDQVLELVAVEPLAQCVEFERAFDPSIPEFRADPNRLTQVFLNIARNAIQAMGEEGGRLTITTRMALQHRLLGDAGRPVRTLTICFADTGPGIAAEMLDRIATPFFTTRSEGTGLGLAVSRHWLTLHGGRLRAETGPGPGARLCVDLPLRTIDSPETPA